MVDAAICEKDEFSRVSAAVAGAIDGEGRPSKGTVLMVGMTLVAGVVATLDAPARQEIMTCFSSMIDAPRGQNAAAA